MCARPDGKCLFPVIEKMFQSVWADRSACFETAFHVTIVMIYAGTARHVNGWRAMECIAVLYAIGGARSIRVGYSASSILQGLFGGSDNMRRVCEAADEEAFRRQSSFRRYESMGYIGMYTA